MNMKKTAVAFAVAGLVAAPVASKAEAEIYASIWQDLTFLVSNDADEDATDNAKTTGKLYLRNSTSRWGLRFTEETDDGTKYFGRYELSLGTDQSDNTSTRLAYAGVDFGNHQITIGSQWSAWYNYAGNTYGWLDGRYPLQNWPFRHRAINWLGEFGPVNVTVDLVAEGPREEEVVILGTADDFFAHTEEIRSRDATGPFDEVQVGASFDLGDIDLTGALRLIQETALDTDPDDTVQDGGAIVGLGVNWALNDDFGLQFNIHLSDGSDLGREEGYTQFGVLATLPDGFWVGIGSASQDDIEISRVPDPDGPGELVNTREFEAQTRITGGWNKGISEHASFFAEFVVDTTKDAAYTNVSAGWIMNF